MIEITLENYESKVIKSNNVTLLDVSANWCGPCKTLKPILERISVNHPEFNICKLDVDSNSELVKELGVKSVPTCFIFNNGVIINKFTGIKGEDEIIKMLTL